MSVAMKPDAWRCSSTLSTSEDGQVFSLRKSRPKGWFYSEALYATRQVQALRDEHKAEVTELLAGLRSVQQYLGYGQLVSASTIIADLLAKHGGAS